MIAAGVGYKPGSISWHASSRLRDSRVMRFWGSSRRFYLWSHLEKWSLTASAQKYPTFKKKKRKTERREKKEKENFATCWFVFRSGDVVDAVSTVDLVPGVCVSVDGAPDRSYASYHLFSRRDLPQWHEPQPVGGCNEHLHKRVWIWSGNVRKISWASI